MVGLRLRILIGERFKVGGRLIEVVNVRSPEVFTLEVKGGMNQRYEIVSNRPTEILPKVMVTAIHSDNRNRAYMVIDAPADIRIERLKTNPAERFAPI